MTAISAPPLLVDTSGRRMRKLRVQLTDACNFRCTYCMPLDARFLPPTDLLPPEEIARLCGILVRAGIEELRLTGGEPLARREFPEIVERLSDLPLARLGLTTNGSLLRPHLPLLERVGARHLNVSLDSLRADRFRALARSRAARFDDVLGAVREARDRGLVVKLNCVLMRGVNDDEIGDFVAFSESEGVEVRFLELMRVGPFSPSNEDRFVAADEARARIASDGMTLVPIEVEPDSTAFLFATPAGGRVGFIASESKAFCSTCSRLRLTAKGGLRACLFSEAGLPLKGKSEEEILALLPRVLALKPQGRIERIDQPMNEIGG